MKNLLYVSLSFTLLLSLLISSCEKEPVIPDPPSTSDTTSVDTTTNDTLQPTEENPAAPGFNFEDSDTFAIALADSVMKAMGGRQNWDQTRYIQWSFGTFLSTTKWIWDKLEGRVRQESGSKVVQFNIYTSEGSVYQNGVLVTDSSETQSTISESMQAFYNDQYWLIMPFKLKDSGVALKYLGEGNKQGKDCFIIELTFTDVGVTPENKYKVYVEQSNYLVSYREYYQNYQDSSPTLENTWGNYNTYGSILLSDDRGFFIQMNDLAVYRDDLPDAVFEGANLPDISAYEL